MQAKLTVVLTAEELQAGAIAQARAAAQASVGNAPTVSAAIAAATCQTDIQATAPSTFTFELAANMPPAPATDSAFMPPPPPANPPAAPTT